MYTGLSDPQAELNLVPDWVFSTCSNKQFRTSPHKQTLNPNFSAEFLMQVIINYTIALH